MTVAYADPGKGDPAGILAAAQARSVKAATVRDAAARMSAAAAESAGSWSGASQVAFAGAANTSASELGVLASRWGAEAAALDAYGKTVQAIKDEQTVLQLRLDDAERERRSLLRRQQRIRDTMSPLMMLTPAKADDAEQELQTIAGEFAVLGANLFVLRRQWDDLVVRRDAADRACATALSGVDVVGASAAGGSGAVTAADLAGLSATELLILARTNPAALDALRRSDPAAVAAWWAGLSADDQDRLVNDLPAFIGALGGIPPLARVAANRVSATQRVAWLNAQIERLHKAESGTASSPSYWDVVAADPARERLLGYEAERDYLLKAVDGKVQLYLYDPATSSIIEMIGTPGPDTTAVNTYVPGTYTSRFGFYDGSVQQVGRWLNERDSSQVTFVWKVGVFPGENDVTGGADLFRIGEANDQDFTLGKGKQVAAFASELHASLGPTTTTADFNAIGHSWGLAAVTSAEVAGAHFDNVISLAGAGMPDGWEKQDGTTYSHFSYRDALSMAQQTGTVWGGHNPGTSADFIQHQYSRDGDFEVVIPSPGAPYPGAMSTTPPAELLGSTDAMGNHNLIASGAADNWDALNDVLKALGQ